MKRFVLGLSFVVVCSTTAMILFSGCGENSPVQTTTGNQVETTSVKFSGTSQAYTDGSLVTDSGIAFHIPHGSLTPPGDHASETDVDIEMSVSESADGKIFFTFGPSGCQFNPPAEIHLDWDIAKPKLFFVDDQGNFIEQSQQDVVLQDEQLKVYIHHFSRYAISPR